MLATHVITSLAAMLVCQRSSQRAGTVGALADVLVSSKQAAPPGRLAATEATQCAQWLMCSQDLVDAENSDHAFVMLLRQLELSRGTPLFHLLALDAACLLSDGVLATKITQHVGARPWWLSLRGRWRKRLVPSSARCDTWVHSAMQVCHPA